MPRVYTVQAARPSKFRRVCVTCGAEIQRFETYRYAEPRVGPKLHWCYKHLPKRSQLSTSKLGPLWDTIDEFDVSQYESLGDLEMTVQEIISIATDIQGEYEDSLSNMPTQEGPVGEQMQETIDLLTSYLTDLENLDFSSDRSEEEERAEVEMVVVREMLDEKGIDYEDSQLEDPILRGELISEHLDYSAFEQQVNERVEEALNESLEEVRSTVADTVGSFEG